MVRGLVDHKGVALGQTDLRELDRAGQMEDLERQALEREHLQPRVLGDEEAAALAHGHADAARLLLDAARMTVKNSLALWFWDTTLFTLRVCSGF